jgi:hypothetical protein
MNSKRHYKKISYVLILSIVFVLVVPFSAFAVFEDDNFIKVQRISEEETAILYEEKDIVYRVTGEEFPLTLTHEVVVPKEIMLVIDVSGSMGWQIGGGDHRQRLSVLKTAAVTFINKFTGQNVKIGYTTYSSKSNEPSKMYDMSKGSDQGKLISSINKLKARGATNIGDGIRRGYYDLASSDSDSMKYMIMMTDGEANYFTSNSYIHKYKTSSYYNYDSYMKLDDGVGYKYYGQSSAHGLSYATKTAGLIKEAGNIGSYVVGFSSGSSDYQLQSIGEAAGSKLNDSGKHFFKAISGDEIVNIYETIGQEIYDELGFKSAQFNELLPLGVEPVTDSLPEGFTSTEEDSGRYRVTGNIDNLKLVKQESGNYQVEPVDINIRVKFNTVGKKEFGRDDGMIDYIDPFDNNKKADFEGQFDVLVGNPIEGISSMSDLEIEKGKTDKTTLTIERGDDTDIENTDFEVDAKIVLAEGNENTTDLTKASIEEVVKNLDGTIDIHVKGISVLDSDKIKLQVNVTDNVTGNEYEQYCDIKIYVKLTSVGDLNDITIKKGSTEKAFVSILPTEASDVTYKWEIEDTTIAELEDESFNTFYDYNGQGKIESIFKGLKNGETNIKLTIKDKYSESLITKECKLKVGEAVKDVGDLNDANIKKGETKTFEVSINPSSASDVSYKWTVEEGLELIGIESDKLYDYDGSGKISVKVKGVTGGDSKLSLLVVDNFADEEISKSCNVHVYTPISSINLPSDIAIIKGSTKDAIAVINPEDASDFSVDWSIVEGGTNVRINKASEENGERIAELEGLNIGTAKLEIIAIDNITGEEIIKYSNIIVGVPFDKIEEINDFSLNQNREKIIEVKVSPTDVPISKDNFKIKVDDSSIISTEIIEENGSVIKDGVVKIKVKGLQPGDSTFNIEITDIFDYDLDGELKTETYSVNVTVWRVDVN